MVRTDNNEKNSYQMHLDLNDRNQGAGPFLLLYLVLKLLNERKISFDDIVQMNPSALQERGKGIVGYTENDRVTLLQVLQNYKVTAGTDSLYLLANHILLKTKKKVSQYFKETIETLNLTPNCAVNLSGKANSNFFQHYQLNDIGKIAEKIASINPYYLDILGQSKIVYKAKNYLAETFLLDQKKIIYFFSFFKTAIYWCKKTSDEMQIILVDEVQNSFQRDSLVERALLGQEIEIDNNVDLTFNKNEVVINLIGDTYLGEYYSERRRKRKVFDPLLDKDYDYSFRKLSPFLHAADLNIANHEACFIDSTIQSPLQGLKKFILGANDQPSLRALKNANIHCLSLANNHTADYGEYGIQHTIKFLTENAMSYFGVGRNELDAARPYRIEVNNRKISFYAGYWHRATNQKIFNFYATPTQAGVSTLESALLESIQKEREVYPEHFIIVLAHWGVDFLPTHSYQRVVANMLVEQGADLIVGHGAHTLQSIERVGRKTVIYSMGNGIFNSDGEFDGYPEALPYGMITQLLFDNTQLTMRLLPLKANNRETLWQPNFTDLNEFKQVLDFYKTYTFDAINETVWPYHMDIKII